MQCALKFYAIKLLMLLLDWYLKNKRVNNLHYAFIKVTVVERNYVVMCSCRLVQAVHSSGFLPVSLWKSFRTGTYWPVHCWPWVGLEASCLFCSLSGCFRWSTTMPTWSVLCLDFCWHLPFCRTSRLTSLIAEANWWVLSSALFALQDFLWASLHCSILHRCIAVPIAIILTVCQLQTISVAAWKFALAGIHHGILELSCV